MQTICSYLHVVPEICHFILTYLAFQTFARGKSIVSDSSHGLSTYMAKGRLDLAHRMSMQTGSSTLHTLLEKAEGILHANIVPAIFAWSSMSWLNLYSKWIDELWHFNLPVLYWPPTEDKSLIAQSAWMSRCGELYITLGYLILSFHLTPRYLLFNKDFVFWQSKVWLELHATQVSLCTVYHQVICRFQNDL